MNRTFASLFLALGLLVGLNGCIFAPAIDSFKKLGVTKSDREALFANDVKRFHEAWYWGKIDQALAYCAPEGRADLSTSLKKSKREERIVESNLDSVDFDDSGFKASVEMRVKAYRVPYYIVQERVEKQQWRFSLTDGWRLVSREIENVAS